MKKIDSILEEVLKKIKPEKQEIEIINQELNKFLTFFKKRTQETGIDAEAFVGGSFAKNTAMKKDFYDLDIFIRFDKKYSEEELESLIKKLLSGLKNLINVKGSRNYFRMKIRNNIYFEIVPVIKIKKPFEARNITDLSYSHVRYINKKVKSEKISNQIILAKAFCYANGTYGAESYVRGFSGYSLELLISYYKSFERFLREILKANPKEKIIIDIEKKYRNKRRILLDLNEAKLDSPIILIDPTYKQRNALAALSNETFEKFKQDGAAFLKNPSPNFFEIQKINLEEIKKQAKKDKCEFIFISASTNKQEGDIAGSKLLKFYRHLEFEISKYFEIKNKGFNYGGGKSGKFFFVVKPRKELKIEGPFLEDRKNVRKFKKEHPKTFKIGKKIGFRKNISFSLKEFLRKWKIKNKKKIREMYINKFEINP